MERFSAYYLYLEWLGIVSALSFLLSLLVIPFIIRKMPADYFIHLSEVNVQKETDPIQLILFMARNGIGILFVVAGILMLFMPGQGILTIIIGLLCMSFPGKKRLLLGLTASPKIRNSLNWARKRLSCPPFRWNP